MGSIKQGILGGFSGKVGGVVGTAWKGIAVMKAMPLSVANPRTSKQVNNRNRNTGVLRFAQAVGTTFIRAYWNRFAKSMSGFNDFMSVNYACFLPETSTYDPSKMFSSVGKLTQTGLTNVTPTHGLNIISNFVARSTASDYVVGDLVDLIHFNVVTQDAVVVSGLAASATTNTVATPSTWTSDDAVVSFLSCRRADGTAVSTSVYKESVVE